MTDYAAYRDHVKITNVDMTKTLHESYPAYTRIAATFVNKPEKYGVCLLPEAEALLVETYGEGPGLATAKKKKRPEKRRKSHCISFRMTDDLFASAQELMEYTGAFSMQELLEIVLKHAIKLMEEN